MTEEDLLAYVARLRETARSEGLPAMREKTAARLYGLVGEIGAKEALDVGTCLGVSALTMIAAGVRRVVTLEKDPALVARAQDAFRACGVGERIRVLEGDCNRTIGYLWDNAYDLIVLDGPKSTLAGQYEASLPMLKSGGAMLIDDVAYHGLIAGEGAKHKQRTIITHMRAFLDALRKDERVTATFYEEEDGYAVVRKK